MKNSVSWWCPAERDSLEYFTPLHADLVLCVVIEGANCEKNFHLLYLLTAHLSVRLLNSKLSHQQGKTATGSQLNFLHEQMGFIISGRHYTPLVGSFSANGLANCVPRDPCGLGSTGLSQYNSVVIRYSATPKPMSINCPSNWNKRKNVLLGGTKW